MKNIVLYASMLCPDCPPFIEKLNQLNVDYELVIITDSMMNLKRFLSIRDNRKEFTDIKKNNSVGIPCLVINDKEIIFDIDKLKDIF